MTTAAQPVASAIKPYLFFDGRCEEAIEFYKQALGAEVLMLLRFRDNPDQPEPSDACMPPPGSADKIMHASLMIRGSEIMMSDGMCGGSPTFNGVSISLSLPDSSAAETVFAALSEGGQVQMPLGPTFFSPIFGMTADRFGVSWMIGVPGGTGS
ncbi:VOC family protein [Hansschlegelia sp. KR7-227]|uniref:VOC family protein n=1 Tax=Hansschlegelia sp. KR7-227 TaxID=3400914 RepID=UPI003BFEE172